jgi:hypothetical protein
MVINSLPVDRQLTLVFSSVVGESRYMVDGKAFDTKRINQQVHLWILGWTLRSVNDDGHPFYIRIDDFQVMLVNGLPVQRSSWSAVHGVDSKSG